MKIAISWLKEHIRHPISVRELADRLTMTGLEVESIENEGGRFQGVIAGQVTAVEAIPNASKLRLCKVDIGGETVSVVCGAPNVREGIRVPVAVAGAVLPGDLRIGKAVIRGVESAGMICSAMELGLGEDRSGIMELDPGRFKPGDAFTGESGDSDAVLEINVTPNRPDCLSVIGIAREVGVIFRTQILRPASPAVKTAASPPKPVEIRIEAPEACPRYSARLIEGVRIGPSPAWLQERLASVGMNAINNVVDVTNFVMMESGQPLHAFDFDLLEGGGITVRKAGVAGEFVTLDGQKRQLLPDDLLICDMKRPVALAGVMGGLNSEVSAGTARILLESAYFDPMTIRRTARRLGMSSEACQRFERGIDPNGTVNALNRAVALIIENAGGSAQSDVLDVYPRAITPREIALRRERLNLVLGMTVPEPDLLRILSGLGLHVSGTHPFQVTVPTFRPDLKEEIDLIEEVIRHYGYDMIEPREMTRQPVSLEINREQECTERIRDIFSGMGFVEAWNNSLVSRAHTEFFFEKTNPVAIQNPLSPETAFLRTSLLPGLLESVRWNHNRSAFDLRMFEIGRVSQVKNGPLPEERALVAGVLTESAGTKGYWKSKSPKMDFFTLKGSLQALVKTLHVRAPAFSAGKARGLTDETATLLKAGPSILGTFGEISPAVLGDFGIDEKVFAFELDLTAVMESSVEAPLYRPIPKFPSVRRDLAVVVTDDVPAGDVEETLQRNGGSLLQSAELFDEYQGRQIPEGKKSLAFSLLFSAPDRTLKEEDIEPVLQEIVRSLENAHGASLRAQ
jgi:phenylalanyl-tRNA synthetase beta chain